MIARTNRRLEYLRGRGSRRTGAARRVKASAHHIDAPWCRQADGRRENQFIEFREIATRHTNHLGSNFARAGKPKVPVPAKTGEKVALRLSFPRAHRCLSSFERGSGIHVRGCVALGDSGGSVRRAEFLAHRRGERLIRAYHPRFLPPHTPTNLRLIMYHEQRRWE